MKELYTNMDSSRIGMYKSILDEAGIACYIQNENTAQLVNMISPIFQPTLCILDDERYDEAVALLKPLNFNEAQDLADWNCAKCGESNPGSFEVCWNCESEKVVFTAS